jgi:hypothetical protein
VLRELDKELAAVSARTGVHVSWTPQEQTVLALIADQIDRKVELSTEYQQALDVKAKAPLSAEIRLLENSIARMLKQLKIDEPSPPGYESQETKRARHAARKRWYPNAVV